MLPHVNSVSIVFQMSIAQCTNYFVLLVLLVIEVKASNNILSYLLIPLLYAEVYRFFTLSAAFIKKSTAFSSKYVS